MTPRTRASNSQRVAQLITIIHGPGRSGKSRRADALKRHFKAARIVDGWDGTTTLREGDLALTALAPFPVAGARWIDIGTAKALLTG